MRAFFSLAALIAAIHVLAIYVWKNDGSLQYCASVLCVVVAVLFFLHLLQCKKVILIPFLGLMDVLILILSLYVISFVPELTFLVVGALAYSTTYVYWIIKETGKKVLPRMIAFWISIFAADYIIINALILYRMALSHGSRVM